MSLSEIFHALFHPTLAQCPVGLCPACACPPLSLPDSLHTYSLRMHEPCWESWSPEKAAALPVEKVTRQGLAGNFSKLCTVLFHFSCTPRRRLHSKVKRQNTAPRRDRMGYLCSYLCLSGICHGADDWKAKVVCKAFFCPLVLCLSAQPHTHMVADTAGWHPTPKCCVAPFCAQPRVCIGETHFATLMCILVTQFCTATNRIINQMSFYL